MEGDNIIDMIKQQTHTGWDMAPRYPRYGDDAVAKALVSAERRIDSAPQLAAHAAQLRSQQLNAWLDNGKSVDDVFKLLKLGDDGYQALASRKLTVLDDYIVKFNRENPGHETTLLKTLTKGFGGEGALVPILAAAKHDMRTVTKAKQLEKGLLRQWRHENLEPASVMKLLKLDDDVNGFLKSRNLWTFEKYIAEFNKKNPENQVTLLGALTSKYEEGDVARAIVSGLKNENTAVERVAARLQKEQLEGWLKRDKSVNDVFKLLKFKDDGSVEISRNLETLEAYILLYNRAKQVDETLVGALAKGFGGESQLAEMLMGARSFPYFNGKAKTLQNAQFKEWRDKGLNPTNVLSEIFVVAQAGPSIIQKSVVREFTTFIQTNKPAVMRFTVPRRS
ncbi:hypothetical protein PC129_g15961 [Phytophthora cactorum]|uniref:RxLR effector protein n=1 Tax=Phytophthora cactorum TaxID=29920 RepID=A0A8T1K3W5_9STRA|nr:hypothetical protein PC115_g16760 [Phytophthora cactorum]KAG2912676.1 hypothetical protein PC117_g18814 [Phytophthora cactorum]KAG3176320.1 hypothetical protein C6341_g9008 [Phytophthora cactorum]KAG3213096.1 hypothetical protein PC129_g15961 [Phytophthora cactorum]KAG4231609.1 hypothetical protein PC116_g20115 [Phytophthora cactorum]